MDKKLEVVEDALIVFGVALSIDQIKTILGIILLCIQIGLILYKGIKLLIGHIKNKNYKQAVKDVEDMTRDIQNVIDKSKEDERSKDSK